MSRILKAYRTRFHQTLKLTGARRLNQGVDWLESKAKRVSAEAKLPLAEALHQVFEKLATHPKFRSRKQEFRRTPSSIVFFCDAGLGGLARWLRASGYRASWEPGIDDDLLLVKARELEATLLTTDSMLMERRLLRDRIIPSFWLPPTLSIAEQLKRVFEEFELSMGHPRCMSCGGELIKVEKESLRDRIPPKTYRWLDEYFVCQTCGKLFWHGTHWQRISRELKKVSGANIDSKTDASA